MATLGLILSWVGLIIAAVGGIWLLIVAFQESILWGIGSFLIPLVALVFVIMHWDKGGKPFLVQLGGAALMVIGMMLGGGPMTQ